MENKEISQRLQQILERLEINQTQFAEAVGIEQSNMNKYFLGKRQLGKNTANAIALAYGVNPKWLLFGEGEMMGSNNDLPTLTKNSKSPTAKPSQVMEAYNVPLIHIDSVGGIHSGNEILTPEYVERYIPIAGARYGDIAIYESGTSMYPVIPPGSILLIREVSYWREYIGYGDVFVLLLDGDRRITKEIQKYEEDPDNYFWCVSYNPKAADEALPKRLVQRVWRVVKILINRD